MVIDFIDQIKYMNTPEEKVIPTDPNASVIILNPPPRIIQDLPKPKGIPAFIIKKEDKDSVKTETKKETKDSLKQKTPEKEDSLFIARQDSLKQDSVKKQDSMALAVNNSLDISKKNGVMTMKVDSLPEFPGGEIVLNKFLDEHIKYTLEAIAKSRNGTIYVSFTVKEDGRITGIKLIAGLGSGLDDVVISTIKSMPHWKPGIRKGKPQRFVVYLPVSFYLK